VKSWRAKSTVQRDSMAGQYCSLQKSACERILTFTFKCTKASYYPLLQPLLPSKREGEGPETSDWKRRLETRLVRYKWWLHISTLQARTEMDNLGDETRRSSMYLFQSCPGHEEITK